MNIDLENETALVEAILFMEGDSVNEDSIISISGISKEIFKSVIENLNEKYSAANSGIELLNVDGKFKLFPKRELWENLREEYGKKNDEKISRAAMETLAIVAYSQPVTKTEIEKIRGCQADNMIRLLLKKELIHEAGKKDVPGKPYTYVTTKKFLELLNIKSIADLPKLDDRDIERFELEGEGY